MLFFFFLFTKLHQMSRVGSRGRHPKYRPKNQEIKLAYNIVHNGCIYIDVRQQITFLSRHKI